VRLRLQSIIRSYRQACALAVSKVKELSVSLEGKGEEEKRGLLVKCAATSLNSKLVRLLHLKHQQQRAAVHLQQVLTALGAWQRL
jgi:chaperonin GroEL (HSP60 family)